MHTMRNEYVRFTCPNTTHVARRTWNAVPMLKLIVLIMLVAVITVIY